MKTRTEFAFYVSVGVGMALATSSFTVVSGLFQILSDVRMLVLSVLLAGLFCSIISLSIAELASMFPSAPGVRTFLKAAFGGVPSLAMVYLYLMFTVLMAGVEGFMFSLVVHSALPAIPPWLTVLVLMAGVTLVNVYGLDLPRGLQMVTAFVSVSLLLGVSVYGLVLKRGDLSHLLAVQASPLDNLALLPASIGMAIFLYMGFEWVTPVGLRPKAYEKLIPLSLPVCVAMLGLMYMFFVTASPLVTSSATIAASSVPHVLYFEGLLGPVGTWCVLALSFGAIISTFNAGIMGGSKLIFMLAREGQLPEWLGRSSDETGAPYMATLSLGAIATVSALLVTAYQAQLVLAVISASIMCTIYGAFMFAALRLRKLRPNHRRAFKTRVPSWLQWGVGGLLPLMGLGSLFSLPEQPYLPAAGMGILLVLSGGMTWLSHQRNARKAAQPVELAE